ncbi:uncharacterized protein LOC112020038 [Quercus suber]|uniref:uncharacterized protein LOC112020038 n=1 Tax=Quercus suber TaxID=58331 RepID=UPI000CE282BB|nr:uncharacterized protein LOC112020038 [Quercus suber]
METNPARHFEQGPRPKKGRTEEKNDRDNERLGSSTRNQQYTPLNVPLEQVLMQIKDDPSLKWHEKMKGDPNKRNRNKYCHFHRDHGHDTDKCFDLKQQIENLIRQGKLRNFLGRDHKDEKLKGKVEKSSRPPLGEIRVIMGGRARTTDEQAITFTDEDARGIHHPHDDAIVITLVIANYTTKRVLIDNGSSADILYYPAFQQMKVRRDQLCPVHSLLMGFRRMKVQPVGTVTLPVVVGTYPQQVTKYVSFLVVDCSSSYNAIIGRPTLNSWKAVTSTYHLSVKFPTEYGVGQVQGNQLIARESYLAMLAMDEQ